MALNGMVLSNLNAYDSMTQTSISRVEILKRQFVEQFDYDAGTCQLSGVQGTCTLAHILPVHARKISSVMQLLQMTESMLNSPGNLLLLASNIERAFDALKVSFVARLGEGLRTEFVLKIWDESVRSEPIFSGSAVTIGDCEHRPLMFNAEHHVYSRCFAYQGLWAAAKYLGGDLRDASDYFRVDSLDEPHQALFMQILAAKRAALSLTIERETEDG